MRRISQSVFVVVCIALAGFASAVPAAAQDISMADRVKALNPGDWYEFTQKAGPMELVLRYEVMAKDDQNLKYKMVTTMPNVPPMETVIVLPLQPAAGAGQADAGQKAPDANVKTSRETVELAGKSWDCLVTECETDGVKSKVWMPDVLPWVIKMELNGEPSLVLKALGSGDGKGAGQAAGQDSGKGAGQDSGEGAGQDSGKGAGQDSGKGAGQDSGEGAGQDSGKGAGQDLAAPELERLLVEAAEKISQAAECIESDPERCKTLCIEGYRMLAKVEAKDATAETVQLLEAAKMLFEGCTGGVPSIEEAAGCVAPAAGSSMGGSAMGKYLQAAKKLQEAARPLQLKGENATAEELEACKKGCLEAYKILKEVEAELEKNPDANLSVDDVKQAIQSTKELFEAITGGSPTIEDAAKG